MDLPIKEYIKKNYIHKDKIKEKIKELESKMQKEENDMKWIMQGWAVQYLKEELLEDK